MPDSTELIALGGAPTPVCFRRSARARRVNLRIDPGAGHVVVTLPPRASRSAGLDLLRSHAGWVADRLAKLPEVIELADGACVPVGGVPNRIRHMPGARGGAWLENGEVRVSGDPAFLKRRVLDLLRREAKQALGRYVATYAGAIGCAPSRLVVKDTRSRWGSCAPDRTVMLNWRLVMAPAFVGEYVAAHEVAHLRHMNHGAAFWALVGDLVPQPAVAIEWLKRSGPGLFRVG